MKNNKTKSQAGKKMVILSILCVINVALTVFSPSIEEYPLLTKIWVFSFVPYATLVVMIITYRGKIFTTEDDEDAIRVKRKNMDELTEFFKIYLAERAGLNNEEFQKEFKKYKENNYSYEKQ